MAGLRLKEMDEPARCCGGAGSFALTHAELSVAIGARKSADILDTGAQLVATACPGCKMQLADVLFRAGGRRPVVHVVELLAAESARGSVTLPQRDVVHAGGLTSQGTGTQPDS